MKKNETKHTQIIAFQHTLRPAPPKEKGPKEYRDYRDTLIEMDNNILTTVHKDLGYVCLKGVCTHENIMCFPPSTQLFMIL